MGGDCLWTGCVPSKALIAAAAAAHTMRTAGRFGLPATTPTVDLAAVMASVRATQAVIEPHDSPDRLRDLGIEVITGSARFTSPTTVDVDGRSLRFRRAAIAATMPAVPPPMTIRSCRRLKSCLPGGGRGLRWS